MPKRIQRKRVTGWRLPEGAALVCRPTIFGNPWVGRDAVEAYRRFIVQIRNNCFALAAIEDGLDVTLVHRRPVDRWQALRTRLLDLQELAGCDLACYCGLDRECHADILLEIANR
jgi:hypothetical protein